MHLHSVIKLLWISGFIGYIQSISNGGAYICPNATWYQNPFTVVTGAPLFCTATDVDNSFNIFIVDYFNHKVVKVLADNTTSSITVAGGNNAGNASNQLNNPVSVIFDDSSNYMYICDHANNRVVKWLLGAASGQTIIGQHGKGSALNQINGCTGLFVNKQGALYVAESGNHRVMKWNPPNYRSGTIVAGGNGFGAAMNQLGGPTGIFVDNNGNIYVTDTTNSRVQKWSTNGSITIVAGGNGHGSALNQLRNPDFIVVDTKNNIYVDDNTITNDGRIMKWAAGAQTGSVIISGGPAKQVSNPLVDISGNLYITDVTNQKVLRYNIDNSACA